MVTCATLSAGPAHGDPTLAAHLGNALAGFVGFGALDVAMFAASNERRPLRIDVEAADGAAELPWELLRWPAAGPALYSAREADVTVTRVLRASLAGRAITAPVWLDVPELPRAAGLLSRGASHVILAEEVPATVRSTWEAEVARGLDPFAATARAQSASPGLPSGRQSAATF